ncbi:nuclear transport factor 2 family protein [Nocardia alni]|uniref:nuclear transport factor 2 family protein n=1 Tax=Nocardia alni TaxID=2815723 RepID=UPI001C221F80|nr:nuclear transport factor 2 family protein [Nocardia alni]
MDMPDLERLERVEAHIAITQLALRYARSVDARDLDTLIGLFAPDVEFGQRSNIHGPQQLREFFGKALTNFYRSMHQVCGHVVDIEDGDTASGTVYCRVEHEDGDNWVIQLMVYFDRYRRVDGRWLIASRRPAYLATHDVRHTPQQAGFVEWPHWDDAQRRFAPTLPQAWPTWNPYWSDHQDRVPTRTTRP